MNFETTARANKICFFFNKTALKRAFEKLLAIYECKNKANIKENNRKRVIFFLVYERMNIIKNYSAQFSARILRAVGPKSILN
jgi:hypothetical protein